MPDLSTVLLVFIAALITALATGLGALPLCFKKIWSDRWIGSGNALAAGLMLAASLSLTLQGFHESIIRTVIGLMAGAVFVGLALKMHNPQEETMEENKLSIRAALIVGIMTVHSFAEGVGVGVSFAGTHQLGWFITAAIAIHNIPEGLAISLLIVPKGISVWRACGWSIFSSLPQPLMAVPAFLFVSSFTSALPIGLGFAAGAMVWLVIKEIIPEATQEAGASLTASIGLVSFMVLLALQFILVPGM